MLDASFPHKSHKTDKFLCSIRIADPSMEVDENGVIPHCTLVLFGKKFEDLPITQRVGDIIRVHRASVGMYKNTKQFTANIFFNSSWALFSPAPREIKEESKLNNKPSARKSPKATLKEFDPFSFYGKTFTFEKSEQKIIKGLRTWVSQ